MSKGPPRPKDERRAALDELRERQRRAEARRNRLVVIVAAAVALVLVVPAAVLIVGESRRQTDREVAAAAPIEGVVEVDGLTANHVTTDVVYTPEPPVGGDHDPAWQNCGFYAEPVVDENAVHSLEHGAVWVTYDPTLDPAQVDALRGLTQTHRYLLVSPRDGLPAPLVASAWGLQLELDSVDDERLDTFLRKYLQGPQTPEPGAPCSGGVGA